MLSPTLINPFNQAFGLANVNFRLLGDAFRREVLVYGNVELWVTVWGGDFTMITQGAIYGRYLPVYGR